MNDRQAAILKLALLAKRGARPSGRRWTDPAGKAWAECNGFVGKAGHARRHEIRTERAAYLYLTK